MGSHLGSFRIPVKKPPNDLWSEALRVGKNIKNRHFPSSLAPYGVHLRSEPRAERLGAKRVIASWD